MTMDPKTNELVTFLAQRNVLDGILYEPRIKAQLFDFTQDGAVSPMNSDDATFQNSEQYPLRITHLVAAIRDGGPGVRDTAANDARLIQRVGIKIRAHDTFYMNDQFSPAPLWHNLPTAASPVVSQALSSWRFGFGPAVADGRFSTNGVTKRGGTIMGSRDNFEVKVALEYPVNAETEESLRVTVTFHGVGAISRRPKDLTGSRVFTVSDGVAGRAIAPEAYRNDGTEPLLITEMTIHVSAPDGSASEDPNGNIRRVRLSVKQNGNGTNQRWTTTPDVNSTPAPVVLDQYVPASLWGLTTGRAVVHELPKNDDGFPGWLWYPNEGLTIEVQPFNNVSTAVYVGLAGHIVVK